MTEIWKDIEGYEGLYQISNWGRVKSLNYNRTGKEGILKPIPTNNGYMIIGLYKNRKPNQYSIHRLVAQAFIPNPDNLPQVNHKDEDKSNNCVWNLEWCTAEYNMNYGTRNERSSENRKGKYNGEKHWNYGKHRSKKTKNKISKNNKGKHSKKIINLDTGEIFNSLSEAGEKYNIAFQGIYRVCKGRNKRAGGYKWAYYE